MLVTNVLKTTFINHHKLLSTFSKANGLQSFYFPFQPGHLGSRTN